MRDTLLELTGYDEDDTPTFVMKDQVVMFAPCNEKYTSICFKSPISGYLRYKVKETPEEIIAKGINVLKFTNFTSGLPLYIAKDAILLFAHFESNDNFTTIYLNSCIDQAYLNSWDNNHYKIAVKESVEEVKKIIESEIS